MEELAIWYILVIIGIFLSSCSQLLLKKSADKEHKNIVLSLLNWRVITAYSIFFVSLFINIKSMSKGLNLKDIPILESLGYIFVPLLSFYFLNEKISTKEIISIILILTGIIFFYL